jgi:nucleotide-binding universal stress UspA family protein
MEAIVVGVDGSDAALDALSWADRVASRVGADLVAVEAGVPRRSTMSGALYAELENRARHQLELWAKERELVLAPESILAEEDPRTALVAVASELGADLVVIGARGASSHAGVVLGGVAHHLSMHPERPLAVVPAGALAETRHVVVGVDGSEGSLAAVRFCASFASELEVPVAVVLAQEPSAERLGPTSVDGRRRDVETQVWSWVAPIDARGVDVEVVVVDGVHPVAALAGALADRPGSVAVLGTRGQGGFAGLRLGRVPLQLLHHATTPVVMVPHERDAREA